MLTRILSIWIVLAVLAVLNGTLRQYVFMPRVDEQVAHVITTFLLCTVILLVTRWTADWIGVDTRQRAWFTGLTWLVLTIAFEFLVGHFVFGSPWSKILADYNVARGRVWVLVLITTLIAPVLSLRPPVA